MRKTLAPEPWFLLVARWLVWWVYVLVMSVALLTPNPVHASTPHGRQALFLTSKVIHISAYLVLAFLTGWLRAPGRSRWLLLVFLSAHALGTEYLQQFVPSRVSNWYDVGYNHLGLVLGLALSWKWWRGTA
jgi:VanZ family protein